MIRECLKKELQFRTSRSSGPGGQHVNKTESRVELLWEPAGSACLTFYQKQLVMRKLKNRITSEGVLVMADDTHRSQHRNREEVTARFLKLVLSSLVPPRKRIATRPSRSSVEERVRSKKLRGELKNSRRNPPPE
jgi:ribosome-associated protein